MDISQLLTLVVAGGVSIKYFFKLLEKPIADEVKKDKKIMVPRKSNDLYVNGLEKKDSVNQLQDESIIDVTDQGYEIKFDENLISIVDEKNPEGEEERLKKYHGSGDRKHNIESLSKIIHRSDKIKKEVSLKNHKGAIVNQLLHKLDSLKKATPTNQRVVRKGDSLQPNNKIKVPHWQHQYVYSYEEIYDASSEQRAFYKKFKDKFLNGEHVDLDGNSNYCFILLFDLFNDYQDHKDLIRLENQLNDLCQNYPKTTPYAKSLLARQMGSPHLHIQNSYYEYQDYRLGTRYKEKLNLSSNEVENLNSIWSASNNFLNIEFCLLETVKIYIAVISGLKEHCIKEDKSIDDYLSEVADLIATKHFRYKNPSRIYQHHIESIMGQIYLNIFKHCENAIRELYGHKRKLDINTNYKPVAQEGFETKVVSKVIDLLKTLTSEVSKPDEATEIELNSQNPNRWKDKFNYSKEVYEKDPQEFLKLVSLLEKLNKENPSLGNLFLEVSKFLLKRRNNLSLSYYIKYLYQSSRVKGFDDKKFVQSIHKSLFKNAQQLDDFNKIVNDLIKDKDLDKALNAAEKFYEIKRKKIELNKLSIKAAKHQHSETVSLLSEYLKEDDHESAFSQEMPKEILKENIVQGSNLNFISDISFNEIQAALVELFEKNNFSVPRNDLEMFARSNSVFESRIIESINEACYDILDDVLIEEEDNFYTMSQSYFNKIKKNDR